MIATRAPARTGGTYTMGHDPIRSLAAAVVMEAIENLQSNPPTRNGPHPDSKPYGNWALRWRNWIFGIERDIQFFRDPARSARWLDMAGLDWEAAVEKLEKRGLLESRWHMLPPALNEYMERWLDKYDADLDA